jgi:hypothetical protein
MIFKREAELKSSFGEELKRQLPGFLSLSYSTNGAPDREIVGAGITTRWEFKHATPTFRSPGDQELMCMRLAAAGHCRYVIWHEVKGIEKTMIAHPKEIHRRDGWNIHAEAWCVGFDMKWLVSQIKKEHRL